jgi:hypothetical protein
VDTLEVINNVLPYLEENTVDSISTTNTTAQLLLDKLNMARISTLTHGYWFNTEKRTLPLTPEGKIETPTGALAVYPTSLANYEFRGEYLYDLDNSTTIFAAPVPCTIYVDLKLEEMPYYAQLYIQWQAAVHAYGQDYGVDAGKVFQILTNNAAEAKGLLEREHLRKKNYNSFKSGAGFRFLSALRN